MQIQICSRTFAIGLMAIFTYGHIYLWPFCSEEKLFCFGHCYLRACATGRTQAKGIARTLRREITGHP